MPSIHSAEQQRRPVMNRILRLLKIGLAAILLLLVTAGGLLAYYVYSPDVVEPLRSGRTTRGAIDFDGLRRSYLLYVPLALREAAPLMVVMHGSGQSGSQIRMETGYEFDRLADDHGFAVVYPDARSFDWNDCSIVGDFAAGGGEADDLGFLNALTEKLTVDLHLDRRRIFAAGVSSGGFMALRLALEAPSRFRAVAAVSANLPAPGNFKCHPVGVGTSVLFLNGSKDPLVPYDGGEVSLLGLFYKTGEVRSARESAHFFATLNNVDTPPTVSRRALTGGVELQESLWQSGAGVDIDLIAVLGGGHGMPQATWRRPRLLGPSPTVPDGPALIWAFFKRQKG